MTATLTVLSGPLAGARLEVEDGAEDVLVGSDPDCRLALDLPGVSPVHARLGFDQGSLIVADTRSASGLYVNDTRVEGQAPIRDGDVLWLGSPGDEGSVMIQCRLPQAEAAASAAVTLDPVVFDDDPPAPTGDVFFMDEPPPVAPPADDLFFVEDPVVPAVAAPAPVAVAAPEPPPPPAAAPVSAPPPTAASPPASAPQRAAPARPREVPAVIGTVPAARPPRKHAASAPSMIEAEEEGEAPARPRGAPVRASSPPPSRRGSSRPPVALLAGGAVLLLVAAGAGVFFFRSAQAPAIASITPPRVGLGQSVTIAGTHFAETPQGNVVRFGGKPGRVMQASATQLQVEIPEMGAAPGRDTPVPVVVIVGERESKPATVGIFEAPRIHGIAPTVAMPGDEVVLAGAGWGPGAKVQFGSVPATVLDSSPTSIKVTVPALEGGVGAEFPVKVTMGADTSNPAPFLLGRLPLVISVTPKSAAPGDVVTIAGRGFDIKPLANDVRIGGARALVTSAGGGELKVVVPRAAAGDVPVEIRLPGVTNVGQATLSLSGGADPVDFRFVAEPFEDTPGHDHAVLATGLGPAFVVSASGGRSAAERALEAERRLNEAAAVLKSSVDGDIRARGLEGAPSLVVAGRDAPLVEVTLDDAAAYEEDWTGLKGRGGSVSPARVAVWWEAVARDLVLLLVRGDKPHFAADLAPEGKVLADLHAPSRKSVTAGVPRQVLAEARPPVREALRTAALRIPPTVKGPAAAGVAAAGETAGTPGAAALKLDGRWSGSETESGRMTYIVANFSGSGGTFTHERALSVTQPLLGVAQQKGLVRFSVQTGAGPRYYQGRWDGQRVTGTVSVDPGGRTQIATFDISPG